MKRILIASAALAAALASPALGASNDVSSYCSPGMLLAGIGPTTPIDGKVVYGNGLVVDLLATMGNSTHGRALELGNPPIPVELVSASETDAAWRVIACS